ncbi:MAG: ATP-binding protein [Thermodesulfobacteriota bacterium]|nr:ATP-binding protein [Thermodesulfobacteriota bacterium]
MKKYFKYFSQKQGLRLVTIVILVLLAVAVIHTLYVNKSITQYAFVAAVVIALATFFVANEKAWRQILDKEIKEKTKDLEEYIYKLKCSEERCYSLVDSADDLIYTIGRDCDVLSVNQYGSGLMGQLPKDIIGRNIHDFIEYESDNGVRSIVEKIFATSNTVLREEKVRVGERGYWLDTKYRAMRIDQDEVNAVLVISRDITEQKRLEEQLFHTEKLASLGSLSAGVAHEINNPIAIILGFTEILLEKTSKNSKEYEILETIERQGNNCKRIVENLLAFARIPKKTTTVTDVVDDLQNVVNVVMNTMLTKSIDLKTNIEETLPTVKADGRQLEQVFMNIINNAVAAMKKGGILIISAHSTNDNMVDISFSDTGHGIPPENMDKIFKPFFTTKGEGTGLGLSVSYDIVKKFGGDILVKSQIKEKGKESGTTYTVLLPVADGEN